MSDAERARISKLGVTISTAAPALRRGVPCPALSRCGTCRVYDARPMICRLYGASEAMACGYGCRPRDGSPLTDDQTVALLQASLDAGGSPLAGLANLQRQFLDDEQTRPLLLRLMRGDHSAAYELTHLLARPARCEPQHGDMT